MNTIYKTADLPAILSGYEIWFLPLKKKQGFEILENRMLRRIFASKLDQIKAGLRNVHDEEVRSLNDSSHFIRMMKLPDTLHGCQRR
jgi:hypothetical protein